MSPRPRIHFADNDKGMAATTLNWERTARRIRVPLGFVFAAVFLWRARPSLLSLLLSLLLVVPGLWLRGYAAGYVRKNAELTQTGPYAYTRNPLYLGSMLAAFGFAAASRRWELVVLLALLFLAVYLPVILSEEKFLRANFGEFNAYAARVPRLLPRLTPAKTGDAMPGSFSPERYRKHREYNSVMGAAALYAALVLLIALRAHFGAR
jgi:protein-S-isoprenylcysteine O-methyltransferase Ste14